MDNLPKELWMKILELTVQTAALEPQSTYYGAVLGLPVLEHSPSQIAFQAGETRLVFEKAADSANKRYHFAFNIPENQLDLAKTWILERAPLLKSGDGADTFHSQGWNSDGVYFCDPAGNILEFIARHTLDNARAGEFTNRNILSVSEIGLATENVQALAAQLCENLGLTVYDGAGSETFTAVGDENGLLIIVRQGRQWYPNLVTPAEFLPLRVKVEVNGRKFMLDDSGNRLYVS
jgi:catechol-2,3-dioxygenase